jgi:hypothetical protein
MLPKKYPELDRDLEIVKDYLDSDTYVAVAKKHNVTAVKVRTVTDRLFSEMSRMVRYEKQTIPLDFKWTRGKESQHKEFYLQLIERYRDYLNRLENVQDNDPLYFLRINGFQISMLNEHANTHTVGDLLETMKNHREILVKLFGGIIATVRIFEKKLTQHGFDPYGGLNQKEST